MPENSKIAIAVSGGVDSLCALYLLKKSGSSVFAIHGSFFPSEAEDKPIDALKETLSSLQVELKIVDLGKTFHEKIISPFYRDWANGQTPNPCAWCNKLVKFGALFENAHKFGAEFMATGHYAATCERVINNKKYTLLAKTNCGDNSGQENPKDQSYFLSLLSPEQVMTSRFPLNGLQKEQCRKIVKEAGLPVPDPVESRDICFLANKKLKSVWEQEEKSEPGPILLKVSDNEIKVLGEHKGLWRYTEGQRKGLNISFCEPLFVIAKDYKNNALILATAAQLQIDAINARLVSLHLSYEYWPHDSLYIRIRHRSPLAKAKIRFENDLLICQLQEPRFPSAPGQILAVYDDRKCILAGAIIEKCYKSNQD